MTKKAVQRFKYIPFLLMWFGAFPVWAEVGPDKQYFLVKDLTHHWLVYDRYEKEYVPYVAEQHSNQLSINTFIDLESNLHYDLLVYVEKNNYLFLNGSLQENLKAGSWRVMKIDSLYKVFRRPQLIITLYGTAGQAGKVVLIGHRKAAIEKLIVVEEESFLNLKPREQASISNFFILGMLILFTFAAFLFNTAPRAFYRIYSVSDLFQMDFRDDSYLINKPFGRTNLLFVVLLSLELAYLYLFTQDKEYNLFSSKELLAMGRTFFDTWLNYLKITFICFLAFIGKYFGLYILGTLYRLEGIANVHYFKVLQSSLLFFTTMLLVLSVSSFYIIDWSAFIRSLLIIPVIGFYLFRTFLIFFTISNVTTVKNLYLISYLCIVELIPIIIGVRYAL